MKRILIALIELYRMYLSPLKTTKCPYYPTCSSYGLEANKKIWRMQGVAAGRVENIEMQPFFKRRI